jgi:hypothetical protein
MAVFFTMLKFFLIPVPVREFFLNPMVSLFRRNAQLKNNIVDLGLVALTGIYGLLAVNLFQNKFFR